MFSPTRGLKALLFVCMSACLLFVQEVLAIDRGIYINQGTANNTKYLSYLIQQSKATGINTFVIDLTHASPVYASNVRRVKAAGLKYVARIVIFPSGGTPDVVKSRAYWESKYRLVQRAIDLGADQIQLDYIRYNTKQRPSPQNARDILAVLQYFKQKTAAQGVPLQMDVFGETSFKPSTRIGQNIKVFANSIDVLCPMLYPSHFRPFEHHYKTPYQTVYNSLQAIKRQFRSRVPFKIHAYIELSNYHYKMSVPQRLNYIQAQIKAVHDANIEGWYAWSANNYYDVLFQYLRQGATQAAH